MVDRRGLSASYPFVVPTTPDYQPRNEERFRAQMAQANAEINDRLASVEEGVGQAQKDIANIPPPPVVPAFATGPEAIEGSSPDTIISPETLAAVLDTMKNLLVPTGAVMHFAGGAPAGWLLCDGAAVTTANAALRDYLLAAGSPYGVVGADPKVPDLRGEFIRGHIGSRSGFEAGRVFGSSQADAIREGAFDIRSDAGTPLVNTPQGSIGIANTANSISVTGNAAQWPKQRITIGAGGTETRPRNVALRPCIKT